MANRSWYEKLLRIEPGVSFAQWLYERIANNLPAILALLGWTGGMGVIGYVTDWLHAWGPAGIVMFAVGMAAVLVLVIFLVQSLAAYRALKREETRVVEAWKQTTDDINPLSPEFHTKIINPNRLAHPITNKIDGKRLIDCELIGPSNIAFLGGSNISGVAFHECDIIVIRMGVPVANVTVFANCNMIGGRIWKCSVFIFPEMIEDFRKMGAHFVTLTGIPEIDGQGPQDTEEETQP